MNNKPQDTVRLGLMPPLTGLVALYGPEISMAAKIACDEINATGGVLGKPLEIIVEDDGSLPDTAVPAAKRLVVEHHCVAMIGNLLSNSRISVASMVAEPYQIPYLNFSFYEGSISNPYFFHFAALPNQQIEKMIPYMVEKFGPKIYFAGNNYEWPRGSIDAAKKTLLNCGGEIVDEEYFDIGTNDFTELLQRVAKSGADIFVPYAAGSDQLALLTQFHQYGLKEKMAVVMGHYDEAMVQLLPPDVREGLYSSNTYFMTIDNLDNRSYLKRLSEQDDISGIWPNGNGVLTNFGEGTYLCVKAFAAAANQAGTLETAALLNALSTIELRSPQGKVKMDPATQHAYVNSYLSKCNRDGSFELIKSFGQIKPEIPSRYRTDIVKQQTTTTPANFDPHSIPWQFVGTVTLVNGKISAESSTAHTGSLHLSSELIQHLESNHDHLNAAIKNGVPYVIPESLHASSIILDIAVEPLASLDEATRLAIFSSHTKHQPSHNAIDPTRSNNSVVSMAILSDAMRITYANDSFISLLQFEQQDEVIGKHITNICSNAKQVLDMHENVTENHSWKGNIIFHISDEDTRLLQMKIEKISDSNDQSSSYLVTCVDPLHQHHLATQNERILMNADAAILAVDETGTIIQANNTTCSYFDYDADELIGMSVHMLLPPHLRGQHQHNLESFLHSSTQNIPMGKRGTLTGYRKDGTFFPLEASISKFSKDDRTILVATMHDLTEQIKIEESLLWQATHDPLTKLPNRTLITERLENSLARTKNTGQFCAVLFIDLDSFKLVNDNYGHQIGDQLLAEISERLVSVVRPGDTVGRFGGDEFIILCDQLDDQATIDQLAQSIINVFQSPIHLMDTEIYSTVSIGIVLGDHTSNAEDLLRNADAAMYHVKDNGRDGWTYFNATIANKSKEIMHISNGLRHAIENHEFHLVYQPIVDIQSQSLIGSEALIRWVKDDQFIPPDIFIQIAEKNGAIHSIGEWVFRQACMAQASWQTYYDGVNCPYTSINLSAKQLENDDLVDRFRAIVDETGVNPNNLLLEITETSFASDISVLLATFEQLTKLGFRLAIDDFGTGYSSLSQLMSFPAYLLKIDKSFVDSIAENDDNLSLTSSIAEMAKALHLKITAEGVETEEQLALLSKMGCHNAQGYYFYKPMPYDDYFRLVTENREKPAYQHQ